jgi:two-component system, OmpR family, alkaline phosphatase synthesis response regulator PhoP
MENYLIYSVEDDESIASIINLTLTNKGYNVVTFPDGEKFLDQFKVQKPNLILLDLMLPGIQGRDIVKYIRDDKENNKVAIVIISAKSLVSDKIDGLDLGADDYIEKPFDLQEFVSRVNVQYRKYVNDNGVIIIDDYKLVVVDAKLYKKDAEIPLTKVQFKILSYLFKNEGKIVTRHELFNEIWGEDEAFASRTIDMHIKTLREKLQDKNKKFIKSIYGGGYKID